MIYFDSEPIQNKSLIYNFFVAFSAFEYSLKELGFANQRGNYLQIKWDEFVEGISAPFDDVENLPKQLQSAINYLFEHPPQMQFFNGENIEWRNLTQETNETNAKRLLRILKTVRNNLFHGGKYPYDPIRDADLIQNCLVVLMFWVDLIPEIREGFEQVINLYFAHENEVF
jgi:hypothetical protein